MKNHPPSLKRFSKDFQQRALYTGKNLTLGTFWAEVTYFGNMTCFVLFN